MSTSQILAAAAGLILVLVILWDAFETILVPRRIGRRIRLTRYFYLFTWRIWRGMAVRIRTRSRRESLLGFYGPSSLILLLFCWAAGLIFAFALLGVAANARIGAGTPTLGMEIYLSGETFFTLGFGDFPPLTTIGRILAVLEAGVGFGFLGTVIGYLPTMYTAFGQREVEISLMDARAGSPPSAVEFLKQVDAGGHGHLCDELLADWERWAAQLLETHISYPQLAYYRSQHVNQSWLATLVTILDATTLLQAQHGAGTERQAELTFAMARHALVDITQNFVTHLPANQPERLPSSDLAILRARLADVDAESGEPDAFEERLTELRLLYEPYAQALASYLQFELPRWVRTLPRHNNWQGGPWDRQIHARAEETGGDHF